MANYNWEKRKYVIGAVATAIVLLYIVRLFTLQIMSDDYKKNADSNAFLKKVQYPSRGVITDRHGKLLVYNQPSYDIMVVMNEQKGVDTLDLCASLGITKEDYVRRMEEIKDRRRNPGYSNYTQQLFMSQLSSEEFCVFQEKLFRFPGFYVQRRSIRQYEVPCAALVLGDLGEVSPADIEEDDYYQNGDFIGKSGVERAYEKQLRERNANTAARRPRTHQGTLHGGQAGHAARARQKPDAGARPRPAGLGRTADGRQTGKHRGHRTGHGGNTLHGVGTKL